MGYQYKNTCFADQPSALAAYYQDQPTAMSSGTGATTFNYIGHWVSNNGVWNYEVLKAPIGLLSPVQVVSLYVPGPNSVPAFASCDPATQFGDGLTLGWGVAGAMVLAWGLTYLRRFL